MRSANELLDDDGKLVKIEIANFFGLYVDPVVAITYDLMGKNAVIAARDNGEDSAGRAKLVLQSPEDVVDRCYDMASYLIKKCEDKMFVPTKEAQIALAKHKSEQSMAAYGYTSGK
jgi:hypothetical protein